MAEEKSSLSDYDIVLSCLNGNKEDFAILVDRYKNLVFSVISRMTNNPDDFADLAQEVFLKVYKNLDKYRPDYHFSTWIIRITTNHIIDIRRRYKIDSVSIDDTEIPLSTGNSAEDEYIRSEQVRELSRLINNLPETYRLPIALYHQHNMSYKEIADSLGLSMSKVKNRIFRGRRLLKEMIEDMKERS